MASQRRRRRRKGPLAIPFDCWRTSCTSYESTAVVRESEGVGRVRGKLLDQLG
jgi:hypothetical protein